MVVVGGPIGTDDYIAEFISKEVERKQKVLPYVLAFASTQNKFVYLSQSLSKNFVHLMRLTSCHESTSAGRALKPWDEQLDGLMQIIAGTRSMDCLNRGLAALPACQGGLGIMTTADLADPCFIAGKLSVARSLTNCGPVDLSLAVTSLLDLSQTPKYPTETVVYIYYLASAPARCGPLAAVGAITRPPSQPQTASEWSSLSSSRRKMRRGMGPQSRAAPERRCHQADWRCARCARAWPLRAGQLMRGPSDGAAQGGVRVQ